MGAKGLAGEVAAAMVAAAAEAGEATEAEQLSMLEESDALRKRQPGRPKGAANHASLQIRRLVLQQYGSPLAVLGSIYSRGAEDLAKELGCTRRVALDIIMKAADMALPYVERKLPMEVHATGTALPMLVIDAGGGPPARLVDGSDLVVSLVPLGSPTQQNQGVIEGEPAQSDAEQSDAEGQAIEPTEETGESGGNDQ